VTQRPPPPHFVWSPSPVSRGRKRKRSRCADLIRIHASGGRKRETLSRRRCVRALPSPRQCKNQKPLARKGEGSGAPKDASKMSAAQGRAERRLASAADARHGVRCLRNASARGALAFRRTAAALVRTVTSRLSSRPCFLGCPRGGRYPNACKPSAGIAPPAAVLVPQGVMPEAARERFARPRAGAASRSTPRIASGMRPSTSEISFCIRLWDSCQ
jgi:hypothetical protein